MYNGEICSCKIKIDYIINKYNDTRISIDNKLNDYNENLHNLYYKRSIDSHPDKLFYNNMMFHELIIDHLHEKLIDLRKDIHHECKPIFLNCKSKCCEEYKLLK
jgi:hypothetical protein